MLRLQRSENRHVWTALGERSRGRWLPSTVTAVTHPLGRRVSDGKSTL